MAVYCQRNWAAFWVRYDFSGKWVDSPLTIPDIACCVSHTHSERLRVNPCVESGGFCVDGDDLAGVEVVGSRLHGGVNFAADV